MAVAVVRSATGAIASLTTTATLAASPTAGNVLLFFASRNGSATISTAPSGSTQVANLLAPSGAALSIHRKVVAGGDPTGWSITVSVDVVSMVVVEFSGVDTTTPVSNTPTGVSSASATTLTAPSVTPVAADVGGMVVTMLAPDAAKTATIATGWTRIAVIATGSASFHSTDVARNNTTVADTTTITGMVWTWTGATAAVCTTVLLRPSGAAVATPFRRVGKRVY